MRCVSFGDQSFGLADVYCRSFSLVVLLVSPRSSSSSRSTSGRSPPRVSTLMRPLPMVPPFRVVSSPATRAWVMLSLSMSTLLLSVSRPPVVS